MKPQTEKRPDREMQFFTPTLYRQFNSADDSEADAASDAWDRAVDRYRQRLTELQLPSSIAKLSEQNLHDSVLLSVAEENNQAMISLQDNGEIIVLAYSLVDHLQELAFDDDWPFSPDPVHWLYDEVDWDGDNAPFVHRILLSDGRTLVVPFVRVMIQRVPFTPAAAPLSIRRGA